MVYIMIWCVGHYYSLNVPLRSLVSMSTTAPAQSFALLMVEGSPIGLLYLQMLVREQLPLRLVILSRQPKIADLAVRTVHERSGNTLHWPTLEEALAGQDIPIAYVDDHNTEETRELLRTYQIDLGMLGGTGIIKQPTLDTPRLGIVNVHPSLLPAYRGCSAVEWAIYENRPIGATCHFVVEEIDAGDIVAKDTLEVAPGDLYEDVRRKSYLLQPQVLLKGLRAVMLPGCMDRLEQNVGGTYYKTMPPELVVEIKEKLQKGEYHPEA